MRVLVGGRSARVRGGIVALLRARGHRVVGETGHAERIHGLIESRTPDVAVLEAGLAPSLTDDVLHSVTFRRRYATLGVVVLTRTMTSVVAPPRLADLGVLLPGRLDDADALDAAVRQVAGGGLVVEPAALGVPVPQIASVLEALTPRERDVLDLMARGLSNKGIAEQLKLTTNTVGTHVKHVFDKLGMPESRTGNRRVLAVLAYLNA
jgi:DNA-binding NarL/FixJ family response regulator